MPSNILPTYTYTLTQYHFHWSKAWSRSVVSRHQPFFLHCINWHKTRSFKHQFHFMEKKKSWILPNLVNEGRSQVVCANCVLMKKEWNRFSTVLAIFSHRFSQLCQNFFILILVFCYGFWNLFFQNYALDVKWLWILTCLIWFFHSWLQQCFLMY